MAYEKQEFIDYPNEGYTILKAHHLEHIEDGIATVHNDLYDIKTNISYDLISQTTDILKPNYSNEYASSTFSGWWGCIGKPKNFDKIRFPIKPRSDYPITSITVKIIEIPDVNEIEIATSENSSVAKGIIPKPNSWEKILIEKTLFFEEGDLVIGSYNFIEVPFDNIIENIENKYLFLAVLCNNRVTMGFFKTTYDDIEYNPWIYYSTNGNIENCTALGVGTYDYNSKEIFTLAVEFYKKNSITTYSEIGVEKKDKFFNLVNNCINNSDSFGEIFEEAYKAKYLVGSQNLTTEVTTSYISSTSSTFTGVIFPIGVIPQEYISDGCLFKIRARSLDGSEKPISKVWASLYSVDEIPYKQESGYSWETLNPVLLRTGMVECNIAINTEEIVSIPWNEGNFSNTDGKFLMLGYSCDSYNYRCFNSKNLSGAKVCSNIDGNTYSIDLDTWYSTTQDGTRTWRPHWVDSKANAWSLVTLEKYYDLGEKFYNLLEAALENMTIDTQGPSTSEVRLAKQYDLVVGDTFQLYYNAVIKCFNINNEGIAVRCSKGKEYPRYWEYTPKEGEEGTYTLTIYTRQLDGTIISSGSTKIVVHSKLTNETTPSELTCLIFGDSLTSGGAWAAEGLRRIYGSATSGASGPVALGLTNTVNTYGTNSNTVNTFKVYHEGYGGWTWNSFLTPERGDSSTTNGIVVTLEEVHKYDLDTVQKSIWTDNNGLLWELEDFPSETQIKFNRGEGNSNPQKDTLTPVTLSSESLGLAITPIKIVWETTNPFYDEATQSLDFVGHAEKFGAKIPDIVACLLTWNGGGGTLDFNQESKISNHIDKASQLLRAIHEDCPNAKIIIMGIQISSLTGGTGLNYGADGGYADRLSTAFYAFDYNKALEELVTDSEFGEYCYYVDTKGQFDTIYNMPYANTNVNVRNSTVQEMRGTNGVHPSTAGYYQIGDAFYRALTKVIPLIKQG